MVSYSKLGVLPALAWLCVAAPTGAQEPPMPEQEPQEREPSVLLDGAILAGGQFAFRGVADALKFSSVQSRGEYSLERLWDNVRDPFGSPKSNFECLPCFREEWSHYVVWGGLGAAARQRGHGPLEAWLLTGVGANVWWEYVVEGLAQPPSGRDLLINAGSAALGVAVWEAARAVF